MWKRIPLSLKVDDEEIDFYQGLIEPMQRDRKLTTLILALLRVYHTNEIVRDITDRSMVTTNPYMKLAEELQRITLEHNKQATTAGMMGDYARNELNKSFVHEEKSDVSGSNDSQMDEVLKQMKLLTDKLSTVSMENEQIRKELNSVKSGSHSVNVYESSKEDKVIEQNPIVVSEVEPEVKVEVVKPIFPKDELENTAPIISISEDSEPVVKKPASFSKMMGSIKSKVEVVDNVEEETK